MKMDNRNTNGFPDPVTPTSLPDLDQNNQQVSPGWVKVNGDWLFVTDQSKIPTQTQETVYDNDPVQQPAYRQTQQPQQPAYRQTQQDVPPYDNQNYYGQSYGNMPEQGTAPIDNNPYAGSNAPYYGGAPQQTSYFARSAEPSVDNDPTQFLDDPNEVYYENPQGQAYTNYNNDINQEPDEEYQEDGDYDDVDEDTGSNKKMMVVMIVLLVALLAMVTLFIVSYFKSDSGNVAEGFQNLLNIQQTKEDTEQYTLGDEQKTAVNRTTTTTKKTTTTTEEEEEGTSKKSSSTNTKSSTKSSDKTSNKNNKNNSSSSKTSNKSSSTDSSDDGYEPIEGETPGGSDDPALTAPDEDIAWSDEDAG
jgi:hypothetical protein